MKRGKLLAIYGTNNLGKTYQARRLVEYLNKENKAQYLKYPLYDLVPSGIFINRYLREGNPEKLSAREFQMMQVLNRTQFDYELREKIYGGEIVVVEDYIGTGIAWGVGTGLDKDFMVKMNSHLMKEDKAVLLDGERFDDGKEKDHKHEEDDSLMKKVREVHLELAEELGWGIVKANQDRDSVFKDILEEFNLDTK